MENRIAEFRDWLRDFRGLSPGSIRLYGDDVRAFLVSGLTPETWVATGGKPLRAKGRKYSLVSWFKFLGVQAPEFPVCRQNSDPPIYATPAAVLSLLEIVRKTHSEREHVAMLLMYGCGLRLGEVQAMRIKEINFDASQIRVRGKGNKIRHVPLFPAVSEPLRHWLKVGRLEYMRDRADDRVMLGDRGGIYDGEIAGKAMGEALTLAGLGRVHCKPLHWLRHMCATHLYENGWSLAQVQELLGHANIATTMIYIHVSTAKMGEMIRVTHPLAGGDERPRFEVIKVAS